MLDLLKEWIMQYGYAAMYGLLAIGIIGLPVPDEILMTFVGYLVSMGWFSYPVAIMTCFAGSMTGMIVSYTIGYKVGKPFLWKCGKWLKLTPARLSKAEGWFQRFGLWTVAFGYFVPGVRHFTCYLAGISGVRLWRYLMYAGSGALVWCVTFISLGKFIEHNLDAVMLIVHRYVGIGLAAAAVAGGASVYWMLRRKRIAAAASEKGPLKKSEQAPAILK
ncbi:MAG: rane phosphatase-like protein [Paenibacillaceae bacterium]|nr:rane phosphatase-like protein [Paenibacillaceae bacterium]